MMTGKREQLILPPDDVIYMFALYLLCFGE